MGKAEFFILIGGNESGPWTLGEVQAFWRAGAVTLETFYAQPDASEWKPLSAILDIAPPAAATPTAQSENSYADKQRKMIETVVNVMLPLENVSAAPKVGDTMDEPVEPEEVDMAKMRQWLRDKLLALDFYSATDTARESFESYRSGFPDDEQRQAFGEENLTAYCRGEMSAVELIGKTDTLIALQQFRASNPFLDYDAERFKEARRMAGEAAGQKTLEHPSRPILDAYTAEVMRKAVENRAWRNAVSDEANAKRNKENERVGRESAQRTLDRRARRIREQLGLPEPTEAAP
ncbi:MAG TPA: GYF domain-containing protein [Candidatus Limnocylindrales bacterium]|nr:GYF domain-containing protein [Candidatus Limnocylindrales bacterium]